jgi:hypothetical protein
MKIATLSIVALCLVSFKEVKDAYTASHRYANVIKIIEAIKYYHLIEAENNRLDFTNLVGDTTEPVMTYRFRTVNKEVVKKLSVTHKVVKLTQKIDTVLTTNKTMPKKDSIVSSPNIIIDPKKIINATKIIVTKVK